MIYEPSHNLLVPSAQRLIKGYVLKQWVCTEGRKFAIPPVVIDRNHGKSDDIRSQQDNRHCHCLVEEEFSGDSADEDKRNEHSAGSQDRTEHRPGNLLGAFNDCIPQSIAPLPSSGDILHKDDGVVRHHSHSQKKTREGYYVDGQSHRIEHGHRENQCHRHRQRHKRRGTEILHKEEDHKAGKDDSCNDVLHQVVDRILQQLGLVSCHGEPYLRILV